MLSKAAETFSGAQLSRKDPLLEPLGTSIDGNLPEGMKGAEQFALLQFD